MFSMNTEDEVRVIRSHVVVEQVTRLYCRLDWSTAGRLLEAVFLGMSWFSSGIRFSRPYKW